MMVKAGEDDVMTEDFMCVRVECFDEEDDNGKERFVAELFGRREDGSNICVRIHGYRPYFYARQLDNLHGHLKDFMERNFVELGAPFEMKCLRTMEQGIFRKVSCATAKHRGWASGRLKKRGVTTYEGALDAKYRLLHDLGGSSTSWFRVRNFKESDEDIEGVDVIDVHSIHCIETLDLGGIAPVRILSYDLECYSADGTFPDASKEGDVITHIGMSMEVFGTEGYRKRCLALAPCAQGPDVEVCEDEARLLSRFAELVREWDPDFIVSYNGHGFDNPYLAERYRRQTYCDMVLGRSPNESVLQEINLSSNAFGDNKLKVLSMHGRANLDVMQVMMRPDSGKQLDSYSLQNVSKAILKGEDDNSKHDVSYKEMHRAYAEGDPSKLLEVALYCVQDTILPLRIMSAMKTITNAVEMCRATMTHIRCLFERGQQIRVYSLLVREANALGFLIKDEPYKPKDVIPEFEEDEPEDGEEGSEKKKKTKKKEDDKYKGATVLEPRIGAYYDPIVALDFASLYPSIMRAHNMCYSTLVDPDQVPALQAEGVEVQQFNGVFFRQSPRGVLPQVLENLATYRKKAKKLMAQHEGTELESIYNAKQLAYKLIMNSVYGFTGATNGFLPERRIAESVTFRGRQMIEETKETVENNFNASVVVYGDSVSADTPLLLRGKGHAVFTATIESLVDRWDPAHDGKESGEVVDLESWTDEGWQRIHRVIRHRLASEKNMMRVTTHTGVVTCTDDHSLVRHNGQTVSPKDLKLGDLLLSRPLEGDVQGSTVTEILVLPWKDQFVYDLTTENHHFQAGTGSLIVHNTDSVMVRFDLSHLGAEASTDERVQEAWSIGEKASEMCSKLFPPPNDLELEKVYFPYFIYTKKRYAAKLWTPRADGKVIPRYIDIKGLQMKRRDTCPFVREVCARTMDMLMDVSGCDLWSADGPIEYVNGQARALIEGAVPVDKLVETRKLGGKDGFDTRYGTNPKKYPEDLRPYDPECPSAKQPAAWVRDKMWNRGPGSEPKSGERVPFVWIKEWVSDGKNYKRAEDVTHVKENGIALDYRFYLVNRMKNPVQDLLRILVEDKDSIFAELRYTRVEDVSDIGDLTHVPYKAMREHIKERSVDGKAPVGKENVAQAFMAHRHMPAKPPKRSGGQMTILQMFKKSHRSDRP